MSREQYEALCWWLATVLVSGPFWRARLKRWNTSANPLGFVSYINASFIGREMLGGPVPSLREPEGGETIDLEARGTLSQIVRLLRAHGLAAV